MNMDVKAVLHRACEGLLRPIALILLKSGMTWREFSGLSKAVFVSVATEEFGISGRPTNVSRTSILTGISRKEVKRQRELLASASQPDASKSTDATRLLSGWHQDPDYVDSGGTPIPLRPHGVAPSFESLFAAYGGDTPQQTLVKELLRSKAIERIESGKFVAKSRYYMSIDVSSEWIAMVGQILQDLGVNVDYNMSIREPKKSRFLGFATDENVHADAVPEFREFMEVQGQQFLEVVDEWLAEHRVGSISDDPLTQVRLGVGLFTIQNDK